MQEHSTTIPRFCACGCGGVTSQATRNFHHIGLKKGEYRRFISHHNPPHNKGLTTSGICACGCGSVVERTRWRRLPRFSPGHEHNVPNPRKGSGEPLASRLERQTQKTATCWIWLGPVSEFGYGKLNGQGVHRISYELHLGPIPEGMCICHKCDNRLCINPEHLFLGTNAENTADRVRKGRSATGMRNGAYTKPERRLYGQSVGTAKLTDAEILQIRQMANHGIPQRKLAHLFDVSKSTVARVIHRVTWVHVP